MSSAAAPAEEEQATAFLRRFLEEFPASLGPDDPLPVSPPNRKVTLQELHGESLDLGLRLLTARHAPLSLAASMSHAALVNLLKDDLSPFHCPQEDHNQDEEQEGVLLQSEPSQRLFINKLRDVGVAWHQSLPCHIGSPAPSPLCSVHAIRNTRRKMEDRHVLLPHFNQLTGLKDGGERRYYAVFDGHGGVDAANFAALHLHIALGQQGALQSDPAAAFKNAFATTDNMFRVKAKRERLRSGTTGVAVLQEAERLTVAWLGDSQALLVTQGHTVTLMEPHKPDREDEKQRIEDLGGCITFMGCWRVNGTYAVSRAIGDFDQKPYVSGEADSSCHTLSGDEDYILLACDGFFDAVNPSEVPQLVLRGGRGGAGSAGGRRGPEASGPRQGCWFQRQHHRHGGLPPPAGTAAALGLQGPGCTGALRQEVALSILQQRQTFWR